VLIFGKFLKNDFLSNHEICISGRVQYNDEIHVHSFVPIEAMCADTDKLFCEYAHANIKDKEYSIQNFNEYQKTL